ncbi:MAG: DEAD/DEAH box helicase [bacterium]
MNRLKKDLQLKLQEQRIKQLTEIQQKSFSYIGQESDVIIQSPTGTGKTLAYLLPILNETDSSSHDLQTLIIAPSRELVMQIAGAAQGCGGRCLALPGGANINRQIENLKKKPNLAVSTPGRILELIRVKKIKLHNIRFLVLDEADRLFSSGCFGEMQELFKALPKKKQIILCTASIFPKMLEVFRTYLNDPVKVSVAAKMPGKSEHFYFLSKEKDKALKMRKLASLYHPNKAVVFINHNEGANMLVKRFSAMDMPSLPLHSGLNELKRKQNLEAFKKGRVRFLVTTDIFARGMDIDDIDYVFNFDLPKNAEYYLHRSGRTGRCGKKGTTITLVTEEQKLVLKKFSRQLGIKIRENSLPGK